MGISLSTVTALKTLVNTSMFPQGVTIHQAEILPAQQVVDTAFTTTTSMPILAVTVDLPSASPSTRMLYLAMPKVGLDTIFGEVTMGVVVYSHPTLPGVFLYNSKVDVREVAIKRSCALDVLSRVQSGGQKSQENPLNELALMEHMSQQAATRGGFSETFPHNMSLDLAATDGESIFTILPRMAHCMDLFTYCFEDRATKRARELLPFTARIEEVKVVIGAVLRGLQSLHKSGIAHRDISLENILIAVQYEKSKSNLHLEDVKIIDYGMAVYHPVPEATSKSAATVVQEYASMDAEPHFDMEEDEDDVDATTVEDFATSAPAAPSTAPVGYTLPFYGKKTYAPPECFYSDLFVTSSPQPGGVVTTTCDPRTADIWACGIALFMMMFNQSLFSEAHHARDTKRNFAFLYQDPHGGLRRLLYHILPRQVVLAQPMLIDVLDGMLRVRPEERLTVEEVLEHPFFRR